MPRALSIRRSHGRYERLRDEPSKGPLVGALKRSRGLLVRAFYPWRKWTTESTFVRDLQKSPTKTKMSKEKIHPMLSLFDVRWNKKATARPEFTRYLEYVKEAGMWNPNSKEPVIYYR